ncbi:transposase [Streptomyces sp. NPDC058828]|uniref:IS110 family transposase n=1 Tax=Streptomyces TaxID=1883 RepID=UPI0036CE9768
MTGRTLGTERFPAAVSGYQQLHAWATQLGDIRRAGVESSGNYGAALSRYLLSQGIEVLEAPGPGRAARRRRSKSDRGDAEAAARAVLSGRAHSPVKSGSGPAEIARLYLMAKDSAVKAQRQSANQLQAILVTADPSLREELATLSRRALVCACLELSEGRRQHGFCGPGDTIHVTCAGRAHRAAAGASPSVGRPIVGTGPLSSPAADRRCGHRTA